MIVLLLFGSLYIMSFVYGIINHIGMDILFEVNAFTSPYHHLGISFFLEDDEEYLKETLIIGMVFVNLIIVFYKRR